ncbi:MAG: lysophospholipid acyltransferase family protein [Pseudomonadota bacterium]
MSQCSSGKGHFRTRAISNKQMIVKRNDSLVRFTKIIAKPILYPFFRIKTGGTENLPRNSAFILLPKHQRWEDIPLLGLATPRPLYYVAKYELFLNPFSSWYLSSLGGIPLNRERPLASRRSLRGMIEALGRGEGVVIFPEGTYYESRMGPGHVGLIKMVRSRFKLPFIPVGITYAREKRRISVKISFGRPFYESSGKKNQEFLDEIMEEIARLSHL